MPTLSQHRQNVENLLDQNRIDDARDYCRQMSHPNSRLWLSEINRNYPIEFRESDSDVSNPVQPTEPKPKTPIPPSKPPQPSKSSQHPYLLPDGEVPARILARINSLSYVPYRDEITEPFVVIIEDDIVFPPLPDNPPTQKSNLLSLFENIISLCRLKW